MKCELYQNDLKAYCDNELSFLRRLAMRRHLAACASCRNEVRIMKQITDNLQATESGEPLSQGLRTRILSEAAKQDKPSTASASLGARRAKRRLSPALVGAICVVFAIAAFFVMHPFGLQDRRAAPMVAVKQVVPDWTTGYRSDQPAGSVGNYQAESRQMAAQAESLRAKDISGFGGPPARPLAMPQGYGDVNSESRSANAANGITATPQASYDTNGALTLDGVSLDRQVHREASVTVQLKDPEAASDQVDQMTKDAGGYVASNNLSTEDSGAKSAQMVLKVPVAQFETVLAQIEKMGNVTAKNITGQDITGKVSDATQTEGVLHDEVNSAEAHLSAMGKHAKWEDEEDARELRIQLAEARARLQLLHKLAALGNITVSLTEKPKPALPVQSGMIGTLKGNGSAAFQSMLATLSALVTMFIWILAYIPIWGPIAFAVWYAMRRSREESRLRGT
ncbi:MAG TPA: DUF4349 domain-containing protein [Capsulimonadaceae bacterium]|nr:DUF4349 domain-containing protein [Capsulimonadaceae bacterium]